MNSSLFSKSKLIILSTLIAILLVLMLSGSTNTITITSTTISKQQEALAQTNDNSTFKLYENPTFGIRMQYPSGWEKVDPGQISHESTFNIIVGFVSPKESASDTSPPAAISIGIHNLSSSSSYQNTTLDQYTDVHINAVRREQESLVESTTTTLSAGSNNNTLAHKVVYVNSQGQEVMQVWTIKENKAYHITYAADVARYPDYLPLAQKIIDSFEIGTMSTQEVQQEPLPTVESNNITTIKENNTAATTITTATPSPCCPSDGYNIANAGPDQTVLEGTIITLNGSSSSNNKSSNIENMANYLWRQTDGPSIILKDNFTAHPTFVAPNHPNDTKYTFALEVFENQVINNNQRGSAIDTVDIIVKDINLEAKNPRAVQQEDVNIIQQSGQDELQDEGTTEDDGEITGELAPEEDDDSDSEEEGGTADEEEAIANDEEGDGDGGGE